MALAVVLIAATVLAVIYAKSPFGQLRRRCREAYGKLRAAARAADSVDRAVSKALAQAAESYLEDRRRERLRATPLSALRSRAPKGLRWSALEEAGIHDVAHLCQHSERALCALPGVGPETAAGAIRAAEQLAAEVLAQAIFPPTPQEVEAAPEGAASLLAGAARDAIWARDQLPAARSLLDEELAAARRRLREILDRTSLRAWLSRSVENAARARQQAEELIAAVAAAEEAGLLDRPAPPGETAPGELVADMRKRYADYCAIIEAAFEALGTEPAAQPAGAGSGAYRGLSEEIVRAIQAHPLDTAGLKVTLRRYQDFGARFLVAQRRTVLGDEMGLGKTIIALAAMTHVANAREARLFLVVAPASLLRNWVAEIERRSPLRAQLLWGPERSEAIRRWKHVGGIGVISYDTLRNDVFLLRDAASRLGFLVVDEAHYVKNPSAGRSHAVAGLAEEARRVCLMTGTPLENRLSEFRELVRYAAPEIARRIPDHDLGFGDVARLVAPVYLRRNQEDVLRELPERTEVEEWVDLSGSDFAAYRRAVAAGNYMAMRRAATIGGGGGRSAKLSRLEELLEEYRASGRKVLVFSFFLAVLEDLEARFDAIGTLRGSVGPAERERIIERFRSHAGHCILLSQISVGGVGLNLHAASVVVLMEPQWKPSTESQAIARAHRMGQSRHVMVHRMLARECVDERMVELLRTKQEIFDRNVRDSVLKEASEAMPERAFAERVVREERARLGIAA